MRVCLRVGNHADYFTCRSRRPGENNDYHVHVNVVPVAATFSASLRSHVQWVRIHVSALLRQPLREQELTYHGDNFAEDALELWQQIADHIKQFSFMLYESPNDDQVSKMLSTFRSLQLWRSRRWSRKRNGVCRNSFTESRLMMCF